MFPIYFQPSDWVFNSSLLKCKADKVQNKITQRLQQIAVTPDFGISVYWRLMYEERSSMNALHWLSTASPLVAFSAVWYWWASVASQARHIYTAGRTRPTGQSLPPQPCIMAVECSWSRKDLNDSATCFVQAGRLARESRSWSAHARAHTGCLESRLLCGGSQTTGHGTKVYFQNKINKKKTKNKKRTTQIDKWNEKNAKLNSVPFLHSFVSMGPTSSFCQGAEE